MKYVTLDQLVQMHQLACTISKQFRGLSDALHLVASTTPGEAPRLFQTAAEFLAKHDEYKSPILAVTIEDLAEFGTFIEGDESHFNPEALQILKKNKVTHILFVAHFKAHPTKPEEILVLIGALSYNRTLPEAIEEKITEVSMSIRPDHQINGWTVCEIE